MQKTPISSRWDIIGVTEHLQMILAALREQIASMSDDDNGGEEFDFGDNDGVDLERFRR